MAEGDQATATATAQGSESAPAQQAASDQTQQGAGGSAGQQSQQAAPADTISVPKSEYDSYKANAGRFQQIQQRGDLDVVRELQDQGLTKQEVADIKSYLRDEFGGMTLADFFKAVRNPAQSQSGGGNQQGQQQTLEIDPNDPNRPMTLADFQRLQQEQSQQQAEAAAEKAASQFWTDLRTKFGVTGGAKLKSLNGIIHEAEQQVIAEDLQKADPYLDPEEARKQAREYIPTEQHLQRAVALVEADWKDLGNEIVSTAAKGQDGWPNGSLGGGAGGSPPPPGATGPMSKDQQNSAVREAIKKSLAAANYTPGQ